MEDSREIRCINKSGKVRFISEHLTKDAQYMRQMELTIEDTSVSKKHFEGLKEKILKEEVVPSLSEEDEFSQMLEEENKASKKKK